MYKISDKFILGFYFLCYSSLILGFYLNENSTGGAFLDYQNQNIIINFFVDDFYKTLLTYDQFSTRHSPVLLILISLLKKIDFSDTMIRLTYLHINLLLPYFFYKILKIKFPSNKNFVLFLLSCIIFLSPTFRSLSVWPDSRILGLLLFTISIFFYIKFEKVQKYKYAILNIIFYTLSSYISPNFSVFSIFFVFKFFFTYRLSLKFIYIILINIILCAPAFIYLLSLESNFLFKSAVPGASVDYNLWFNFSNKILCISTIIVFYLIPFLATNIIKINLQIISEKKYFFLTTIFLYLICLYYFNYQLEYGGGGIFFQTSNKFFSNNYLFYFISFLSILMCNYLGSINKFNYVLLFLIILSNPQLTIYHKYFDPFLYIAFFSLFNLNIDQKILCSNKTIIFFHIFSVFFLIISFLK
jgi:hypothetical protein